jgi:hypothetical protein
MENWLICLDVTDKMSFTTQDKSGFKHQQITILLNDTGLFQNYIKFLFVVAVVVLQPLWNRPSGLFQFRIKF